MKLHVKVFGSLAQTTRAREIEVELPDDATGADVLHVVRERFPAASAALERAALAVNLQVAPWTTRLRASDEVALLPPAAGGAGISVSLGGEISVDDAIAAVASLGAGGTAVFVGTVRDHSDAGPVTHLEYSSYNEMAERVLHEIAAEAIDKWRLDGVAVQHALGSLPVGSPTIVVACAAAHRDEAFDACRYVVDELKHRVPVWKKEFGTWGERWVE